ncbi:PREDICTED: uncharacterized protein KIAA1143 homolog isoform X2 [Atta cephalotes]|uniref:DUF4604 domain-containing protein n=1 Tax=Atta cephalotes TaxID=12957 RepID=A0A158NAF9_ATTCE|nr:PREDICTED: uncharacterized protein KIAA1143 homolog isoform X2 [Atta cephalotes]
MSRKKHNVSYIKPNEPKFLRELKEQIGYKEGPTVDTKREVLPKIFDDEREELADEQPVVVVLNSGDLTAEEADAFKKQKEKENNAPADLSKKIIFRKTKAAETDSNTTAIDKPVKKKAKREKQKIVLSFDTNDNDEER